MITNQLLDYIKRQMSIRASKETIINNLKLAGWLDADISEAFKIIVPEVTPVINLNNTVSPQVNTTPNVIQSAKIELQPISQPVDSTQSAISFFRRKKLFLPIFIIILFILAGGGAYAFYSGFFVSLPGLFSESIDNIRTVSSITYDTTIDVDLSNIKKEAGLSSPFMGDIFNSDKVAITVKGSYDGFDENNKKNLTNITFNSGAFSLEAELITIDDTLYGTIKNIPVLSVLPDFSTFQNKWISFPYKSEDDQVVNNPIIGFSGFFGIDPGLLDKITPEQTEHLYQLSRDAHFIKVAKRFPPETITGEMSYHFLFDLDREGIDKYLQALKEYINSIGKDDSYLSAFDPMSFSENLDDILDFKGEVWIGRKDKLVRKVIVDFNTNYGDDTITLIPVRLVGVFSGWNQPVSITAPAESVPLETVISGMISGSLENAQEKGNEAGIKANLSNIRANAELLYDNNTPNSYLGLCSSPELKNIRKAIEDYDGTKFSCKATSNEFVASVKLSDSSGYWCVDSTGTSRGIKAPPTIMSCPLK